MKKLGLLLVVLTALFFAVREVVKSPPAWNVRAVAETAPVKHGGDAADDPVIWVDPADPARSVVIGTDKKGGLSVFDLDGEELQVFGGDYRFNNADLRAGVTWRAAAIVLVAAGDKENDRIVLLRFDPESRTLATLGPPEESTIPLDIDPEGVALGVDRASGAVSVFTVGEVSDTKGRYLLEQWRLQPDATPPATRVRRLELDGEAEGLVVDDEHGALFLSEENAGIWKLDAAPDASDERTLVATVGMLGSLRHDVEGLAIWAGEDGGGYLVASSQGSDDFIVYRRDGDHAYVGQFEVVDGAVDGVVHTDGIEVTSAPLGPRFPMGLFVAQDGENTGARGLENQNFKYVPWHVIAERLGLEPQAP